MTSFVAFKKVPVSKYSSGLHTNTTFSVCMVCSPVKGNDRSAQAIKDIFFKNWTVKENQFKYEC